MQKKYSTIKIHKVKGRNRDLYDSLVSKEYPLDKKFKSPKFHKLLCRVDESYLSAEDANKHVLRKEPQVAGAVKKLFGEYATPQVVYNSSFLSLPTYTKTNSGKFVVILRGNYYFFIFADGDIVKAEPNSWVFYNEIGKENLPMDMRKWADSWIKVFFSALFSNNREFSIATQGLDRIRVSGFNIYDGNVKSVDTIVRLIRKVNLRPSKYQLKVIEKKRLRNNTVFDTSFSMGE